MMLYRVIEFFTDLQDNGHAYNPGDEFPREGVKVSKERLDELSTTKNKQNKILIQPVQSTAQTKADEEKEIAAEKKQSEAEAESAAEDKPKSKKRNRE